MIRDELKRYSIALPPELVEELDRYCRRAHKHRGTVVAEMLGDWLANRRLEHTAHVANEATAACVGRLRAALSDIERIGGRQY